MSEPATMPKMLIDAPLVADAITTMLNYIATIQTENNKYETALRDIANLERMGVPAMEHFTASRIAKTALADKLLAELSLSELLP